MVMETWKTEENIELGKKLGKKAKAGKSTVWTETWGREKLCLPRDLPKAWASKDR